MSPAGCATNGPARWPAMAEGESYSDRLVTVENRLVKVETDVGHIRTTVDRVPTALENLARVSQQIADGMASNRDLTGRVDDMDIRLSSLGQTSAVCKTTVDTWNKIAMVLLGVSGTALLGFIVYVVEKHLVKLP